MGEKWQITIIYNAPMAGESLSFVRLGEGQTGVHSDPLEGQKTNSG